MDILKREMAPITEAGWKEITDQARQVLNSNRSARKFADISGPHGLEFAALSTGRLSMPAGQRKDEVAYGIREVRPLIEVRKPFELELAELDDLSRGARDIDLEPLEKAARQVADFEEKMVYQGLHKAGIKGLEETSAHPPVMLPDNPADILKFLGSQVNLLRKDGVEGPYSLVVNDQYWLELINHTEGYPILRQLKKDVLQGQVIVHHNSDHSFLLTERGGDFELTIGLDTSIGYMAHDAQTVSLHLTGSFTYRTLSPEAVIVLKRNDKAKSK